jgi:hypothetical protein
MIPFADTTVTLLEPVEGDAYSDEPDTTFTATETGVRAHIYAASGSRFTSASGVSQTSTYRMDADPCVVPDGGRVLDELTGLEYHVEFHHTVTSLIPHTIVGLEQVLNG